MNRRVTDPIVTIITNSGRPGVSIYLGPRIAVSRERAAERLLAKALEASLMDGPCDPDEADERLRLHQALIRFLEGSAP